ncbi:MAG: GNAT family N-acetyltransferase [Armatimonadia bacterium]
MSMAPERFVTERLVLRKPRVEDAEAIFEGYAQDPEAVRYLVFTPYSEVEPVREWLRGRIEAWEVGEDLSWVLTYPEEDRCLGMVALRLQGCKADVGYVLARAHWGKGLMPEAVRAVVQWALTQPEIYRVWAVCDVDNVGSRRVMEKVGMESEGVLRRWGIHPNVSAEPRDAWCYSIVK